MPFCTECDAKYLGPGVGRSGRCPKCREPAGYAKLSNGRTVTQADGQDFDIGPDVELRSSSDDLGDPCPTCGRPRRALTNVERQRRYRERHRGSV